VGDNQKEKRGGKGTKKGIEKKQSTWVLLSIIASKQVEKKRSRKKRRAAQFLLVGRVTENLLARYHRR